jgi:hypothetical protein
LPPEPGFEEAESFRFGRALDAEVDAVAGQHGEAAGDRPARILDIGRVEIMVQPRQVEEEALLRAAGLVGKLVEEAVEGAERVAEAGDGLVKWLGAFVEVGQHRPDLACEGADLIAERHQCLLEQPLVGLEGRLQRLRLRDQPEKGGASHVGEAVGAGKGGPHRRQRRRELAQRFLHRLLLMGEVAERGIGGGDEALDLGIVAAEFGRQQPEVMDHPSKGDMALGDRLVEAGERMGERLQATEGPRELAPVAAYALSPAGKQKLQILAGVAVERREEGIEVDVGFGAGERDVGAVGDVALAAARIDLDHHVVEVGFRSQQQRSVAVDQLHVLGHDVHPDHGVAVDQFDRGDLADLDAGDVDRLSLPRGDRLGGGELAGDVGEFFADERQPGRQRGFLLNEDPQHHRDAGERQDDDRDRVFAAPTRLPPQGSGEMTAAAHFGCLLAHGVTAAGSGAPGWPSGPLTSGAEFL